MGWCEGTRRWRKRKRKRCEEMGVGRGWYLLESGERDEKGVVNN
jgi:hypothetical protein